MPEKTFVHNLTDVVLAQRTHVYPTGETYLSNLIFYQMDEGRTSSVSMNGKDRIEAFSAWLTEHVGLPEVDWEALAGKISAPSDYWANDNFRRGFDLAFASIRELYEANALPKKADK